MTAKTLDFWFDFASTYSYPSAFRIRSHARQAGVAIRFRPFLLGPIFKAQNWDTSPFNIFPAKGRYMWRDVGRICDELGVSVTRPDPFPQNSLLAARVATAGRDQPWQADFCVAVFTAEFALGRQIADPAVIADVLAGLDLDPQAWLAEAKTEAVKARLRDETDKAMQLGIFGAPSFVTHDGELFWGNDRLEPALDWASRA